MSLDDLKGIWSTAANDYCYLEKFLLVHETRINRGGLLRLKEIYQIYARQNINVDDKKEFLQIICKHYLKKLVGYYRKVGTTQVMKRSLRSVFIDSIESNENFNEDF